MYSASCDTISQFCFTLSTTFTRIAIVCECILLEILDVLLTASLTVSFIMRSYVVMPKVFIAYVAIGFLSVVGLMSVILDVVRYLL